MKAFLVIIFVKAPHTQSAARGMEPLMKDETIVLTRQKGLGNQEAIEGVLGKGRILIGITSAGALLIGPGRVRHTVRGDIYLGKPEGPVSPRAQSVAEVLSNTDLSAQLSDNAQGFVWTQLLINAAINAPAALMQVRNGEIAGNEACLIKGLEATTSVRAD
jgi:2-dehydropantoate 2-reductase